MKDENAIEGLVGALFGRVKISGRTKGSEYRVGHIDELCHQAASQLLAMQEALEGARKGLCCPTCLDWCDRNPICAAIDAALAKIDALISPNAGGGDA